MHRHIYGLCNNNVRNHCNMFWVDGGIHSKNGGKTVSCTKFNFDISVANDVAKCALLGKVMLGSTCPEMRT